MSPSISGLFYSPTNQVLCNPSTRHLLRLPYPPNVIRSYFGYDPIDKQFSLLAINHPLPPPEPGYIGLPSNYQILKSGSGRLSWRSLGCPLHHYPFQTNICINGILYYAAFLVSNSTHKIVCFDLNSEEFKIIDQPCSPYRPEVLVNFKGKLGGIMTKWVESNKKGSHLEVSLWVLEDIEKQEWSKQVYDILLTKLWDKKDQSYRIVGMTAMGDIVLTLGVSANPSYVYFFNLDKKIVQKVEIKGFEGITNHIFHCCVDYVEELRALKWS